MGNSIILVVIFFIVGYERPEMSEQDPYANHGLPPDLRRREDSNNSRRWRTWFWLIFLLTPVAALLVIGSQSWLPKFFPAATIQFLQSIVPAPIQATAIVSVGAVSAGYCLAKLHAKPKTTLGVGLISIAFGMGLIVVYAAIVFVGCLVVMSAMNF